MTDSRRIEWFLGRAGIHPPLRLSRSTEPVAQDFLPFEATNRDAARQLLVQQRTKDPNYRPPDQQKRHVFRSKDQKAEASNAAHWTFTKHEVAKAFDQLLSQQTLPPAGVGQALLLHTTLTSLDELWGHLNDRQLEKKMKKNRMSYSSASFNSQAMTWLDKATAHDNFNYIHLLCQTQVSQGNLNRAFGIALSKSSLSAMKLLLSFGAVAPDYQVQIDQHIQARNLELVSLLLSAHDAVSLETWQKYLEKEFARSESGETLSLSMLLLFISNRPGLVSESLLLRALNMQSLEATAIVLAYAGSNQVFFGVRYQACEVASRVQGDGGRLALLTLLSESGLLGDNLVLREELFKDVKARQMPLVRLLVEAGVSVDVPPHNALQWAASQLDLSILEILRHGSFSSLSSHVLNYLPQSTSEQNMIQFMNLFGHLGLTGHFLDLHMVRATQKKHTDLVQTFLRYGASVVFDQAAAIRAALTMADLDMLNVLLRGDCASEILSITIPLAMTIASRPVRTLATRALLEKGVDSEALGAPLQSLVLEDGDVDSELVKLLLEHKAPVDYSEQIRDRPIMVATIRGEVALLNMLCNKGPQTETVTAAIPIAFNSIKAYGYDLALEMITLLLRQGASGPTVHQAFVDAVTTDDRLDIVRVLLQHGADANYLSGKAFQKAVEADNLPLLRVLCNHSSVSQASVTEVLPRIIDPNHYNLATLDFFLNAAWRTSPKPSLGNVCALLKGHIHLAEIVSCLLRYGLDVDGEEGMVLCLAVQGRNTGLVDNILASNPSIATLSNAFTKVVQLESPDIKLQLMRYLLEKASSAEIGQSKALLKETENALGGNLDGLWLLLGHRADVNFNQGEAIKVAATEAGFPIILNMLLSAGATGTTTEGVFEDVSSSETPLIIKIGIYRSLLVYNKGISVGVASQALVRALEKHPKDEQLPKLLLKHGAQLNFQTLKAALENSPRGLFQRLISQVTDLEARNDMFKHLKTKTDMSLEANRSAYEALLKQGVGQLELSDALVDSIRDEPRNLDMPKLLLDHGAHVNHRGNEGFITALQSKNLEMIKLLSQYLVKGRHDRAANLVFEHPYLRENPSIDPVMRASIYESVLRCNIYQRNLEIALTHALDSATSTVTIVRLLLQHGADPNEEDGHCFFLAAKNKSESYFRELCRYADLAIVLPTILRRIDKEADVVRWFQICFEEQPAQVEKGLSEQLLFQCMRMFYNSTMLLSLLLENGLSPSAKIIWRIHRNCEQEDITMLMWTIVSPLKISNNVVLRLLDEGKAGKFLRIRLSLYYTNAVLALPDYATPVTKVSAVFLSLLDKSRTPVLEALLKLDSFSVLNSTISGSTFSSMAVNPKKPKNEFSALFEDDDEISAREASLFLGNLDAYKLLNVRVPDDGTLHLASLLALPNFVQWLLETHEANYEEENFGFMVPLALACFSKPFPWCKVAKEETEWALRLEETMKILIPKTLTGWRYRQKLALHLALDNGPEVTLAMLRALNVKAEADPDKKYLYTDKSGMKYSPCEYVETFVEVSDKEKKKLKRCLNEHGLQ
ncbi:hypothetical protein F66182_3086 [Fusarium sp. NRRL 66182]|nr:hypothetical protein F66182_3086 [Fusarium sp. NRRL 66182]